MPTTQAITMKMNRKSHLIPNLNLIHFQIDKRKRANLFWTYYFSNMKKRATPEWFKLWQTYPFWFQATPNVGRQKKQKRNYHKDAKTNQTVFPSNLNYKLFDYKQRQSSQMVSRKKYSNWRMSLCIAFIGVSQVVWEKAHLK